MFSPKGPSWNLNFFRKKSSARTTALPGDGSWQLTGAGTGGSDVGPPCVVKHSLRNGNDIFCDHVILASGKLTLVTISNHQSSSIGNNH